MSFEHARKVLQEKQQELENRIQKIEGDLKKGYSQDWEEQAQERENDDVLDALVIESKEELESVKRALARIENSTYGTCSQCGANISEQRLQVVPSAEFCKNCA